MHHFQTDSYNELEGWFKDLEKSNLINVHLIEPILSQSPALVHSRPYILGVYGTNNRHKGFDILRKWFFLYNECRTRGIKLVGFASDCEPRYLKAMQLSLGFFTHAPNIDLLSGNDDLLVIKVPTHWSFFYMRSIQPYLFMQDHIHLVTKVRNRLLSETASMSINNNTIDISHLFHIIENYGKMDHNLVKSDIVPHDRQNYSSCIKITSDDVLNLLNETNAKSTYIYLYLLKLIIITYVKSGTDILTRLYYGWVVTFCYRMWWYTRKLFFIEFISS